MDNPIPDAVEPIAVVGMGCRFPGSGTSPSELWRMLCRGESAWSEIPQSRMNVSSYFHPSGNRQGTVPFQAAHFLNEDIAAFDSSFFSIPADEARAIDPQQRILLEVAVEALDSAGIDREAIKKSDTGVWIGSFVKDYEQIVLRDPDDSPKYGATGNGIAILSNRISFFLDISGPSMTIDTGCSASLVCVHNACQSLRNREIDMGLAGGVGLILTPNTMMPMTALNFLSPDGKCYTFDARANGYGRGEGIGVVVLKRLQDAIRDNDCIRAVIRGSSVNQDGRTPGITLPSAEAQLRNIRSVYKRAGLPVSDTAYVECHGTGTQAGDWRELKAVSDAFCAENVPDHPIYVGSIKTNIGHLEGCAGIAGLIKGVLTIENGMIPKHLNFEPPGNPAIDFDSWKIKIPIANTPWPVEGLRRASVNCFGFGGTNAHVIMDDAASYLARRGLPAYHNTTILENAPDSSALQSSKDMPLFNSALHRLTEADKKIKSGSRTHLFVFSAHEQKVLSRMLKGYASYIGEKVDHMPLNFMEDLAYTLGCRRTKLQWRTSIVARSPEELVMKLGDMQPRDFTRASKDETIKVALIFGGQGAQWFAMGRELLGFGIFFQSIADATSYLKNDMKCSFDILEELIRDEESSRVNRPDISQPATTAIQVALVDLLTSYFGVSPSSVCGHSSGEIAAAYALGALSREDAWELAFHRGRCAEALQHSKDENIMEGSMLAVGLSASEVQAYMHVDDNRRVVVACINSPNSVTLSGDKDIILQVQANLQAAGIFNRILLVGVAYHSHHMKYCEDSYLGSIAHIKPERPGRRVVRYPHSQYGMARTNGLHQGAELKDSSSESLPPTMYSSVTGHAISWEQLHPEYWVRNMVSPVRFSDAMHQMVSAEGDGKPNIIIECSPHSSLQGPIRQILDAEEKLTQQPSYSSALHRGKDAAVSVLEMAGKLWSLGCDVAMPWVVMRDIRPSLPRLLIDLPKYPWNHDNTYWYESHLSRANRFQVHGRYDLIGRPTMDSIPSHPRWRGFFRISENPWIQDHQVQKTIIYPAGGMITMVLEAAKQVASENVSGIEITQFSIQKAMIIPGTLHGLEYVLNLNKRADQTAVTSAWSAGSSLAPVTPATFEFSICSKQLDGPWEEHGKGFVTIHYRQPAGGARVEHQNLRDRLLQTDRYYQAYLDAKNNCDELVAPRQLYETLDVIGMNYGPLFRNISSLFRRENFCVSTIRIPDTKSVMPANFEYPHIIHPATLDAIFQTAFAIDSEPMVPSLVGSLYISAESHALSEIGKDLVVHTQAVRQGLRGASASLTVSDSSWSDEFAPRSPPLIIIKDLNFTALIPNPASIENVFLSNHRNLCSEIAWETLDPLLDSERINDLVEDDKWLTEYKNSILVLVPEITGHGIEELCTRLALELNCDLRTLTSIKEGEALPEFCISLVEADGHSLIWSWEERDFLAFHRVVTATKGILWVTRASQLEAENPQSCLVQALGRTIQSEYPRKKLVSFDIEASMNIFHGSVSSSLSRTIINLFKRSFIKPQLTRPMETEYIERKGQIMVPRLVPVSSLNSMIERGAAPAAPALQLMPAPHVRPMKLEIGEIGDVGSLYWCDDPDAHLPVGFDEVRVRVISTMLSDLDNDILRGRARNRPLGTDVRGVVEEVGSDVKSVAPGDHVLGIARGSLRDYIKCHHRLVHKIPDDESQPGCPYLPTCFSVARYALGKLKTGDTVLIHAGAGLLGQAAIQVAKAAAAVIFATAETNYQRGILNHFCELPEDHILEAKADALVDVILHLTDNEGVDFVYDPVARSRDSNLVCIKEGGQVFGFAHKPDRKDLAISQPEVNGKTFSCTVLNIPHLVENEPHRLGEALEFACRKLLSGHFQIWDPHPQRAYDYSSLTDAFMILDSDENGAQICCRRATSKPVPILVRSPRPTSDYLHGDATYILSGGLGGLGVEIAKLLAINGVKYVAFLSRSGATGDLAKSCLDFLRNRGVKAQAYKVDICDSEALKETYDKIQQSMPPVKGIFQCAAVLRDSVFDNMTYEDWQTATRPKTLGSWNIYQIFGNGLDFFVFLSSSAGVIGNRGQANYAAGNAFQDSLARHINTRSDGKMHSVSIDLGPVLEAGMLADDPRTLDILKASGFFGIRLQDFKRIVECAIRGRMEDGKEMPAQVVTGVGTGGLTRQNKPADPYWTRTALFTHLNQVDMPVGSDPDSVEADLQETMRRRLAQAVDVEQAKEIVSKGLRVMLSKSMNMDSSDVDESKPPSTYGVDSLVAVGVRNWVSRECEADVSIFEVLSETSIRELSAMIVERRGEA
ncbi:ketoacyl-synt-domain-containing protein [Hypoxylon trugodes]|uniref:ketoacyl-synt-domain-containing protein n=1 Tax=Hypoxylon trugodes TaxID=326681 RepID=UPI00219BE5B4|nr:ketoacyl-synt-domain-containing protein [Hypoxylon trugodes]KAI1392245.1 ketoacyl-synt-domain-containing protein [Hypoxylon trugodes]